MLLYNQSKNHLRWKISTTVYTCEPWGSVEIPDMFVMHCKSRGLPLDTVAIPPEVRADTTLADANDKARNDEAIRLRHEAETAKISEAAAKAELESLLKVLESEKAKSLKLEVSLAEQKRQHEELVGEQRATEQLLEESARKLTESKLQLERSEAAYAELKKQAESGSKKQK